MSTAREASHGVSDEMRRTLIAAVHESVCGTNRRLEGGQSMSALPRYFRHQLVPLLPGRHLLRCLGI
jgi:hypothetical protein